MLAHSFQKRNKTAHGNLNMHMGREGEREKERVAAIPLHNFPSTCRRESKIHETLAKNF